MHGVCVYVISGPLHLLLQSECVTGRSSRENGDDERDCVCVSRGAGLAVVCVRPWLCVCVYLFSGASEIELLLCSHPQFRLLVVMSSLLSSHAHDDDVGCTVCVTALICCIL